LFHAASNQGSDTEEESSDESFEDVEATIKEEPEETGTSRATPLFFSQTASANGNEEDEDMVDSQRPSLEELHNSKHAEWIKIEPDDSIDLSAALAPQEANEDEDELTDHEGLDEDEAENESWTELFATGTQDTSSDPKEVDGNSTLVRICAVCYSVIPSL
jgi:hypothetical protein